MIKIFGKEYQPDAVYGYSLTISFFIVVLLSPFLSSLADTIGNKNLSCSFSAIWVLHPVWDCDVYRNA
jgi:UMF1 family MFS transporter